MTTRQAVTGGTGWSHFEFNPASAGEGMGVIPELRANRSTTETKEPFGVPEALWSRSLGSCGSATSDHGKAPSPHT